jgi:GTPase
MTGSKITGSKMTQTKCGYVALIGAPNAGKSTLLNALVGQKVSIVSPKVQTTRMRILGIASEGNAQILYVDTPGIFAPRHRLDRAMVAAAWDGAGGADSVALVVDASRGRVDEETAAIIERLKQEGRKVSLVLNKVDLATKDLLLPLAASLTDTGVFDEVFMISALTGDGIDALKASFLARLPTGPWLYPDDQLSDLSTRILAAEITREQVFLQLHQELPYAAMVTTEAWESFDNGSVKITQAIYVQRDGQKAIVLGKGGSKIKSIGQLARQEIEKLIGQKVHLMLHVKVVENWMDRRENYESMGLDFKK